ncbi:MAG TPA: M23 family metallopeptidase [Bryobacteraceae bacterium]|jgi:murein DD-endopeptidase MepM/ murein hydrolase activator NlpD
MFKRFLAVVALLCLAVIAYFWFSGKTPTLRINPDPVKFIGLSTPVSVQVDGAHGIKRVVAKVAQQNGQAAVVFSDNSRTKAPERTFRFDIGKKSAPFLKEGNATVTIEAQSNDFRGATTSRTFDVQVILRKPSVTADGFQHYINQGGSELVTFDVNGGWSEAGVKVGPYAVTSYAMPGQPNSSNHRFSLFPYSWDLPADTVPVVYAKNAAGDQDTASFWVKVFPKKFHESTIPLTDTLMKKILNDIDPDGKIPGNLLERYLYCNREMRKQNSKQLYDLRLHTAHKMLWQGAFVRPPAKTESYFADRRSYMYNGKKVDEEVHLGFDLASTVHMPIRAANSGTVIWAQRLGIYGNCIVVDHGYGLQTIYGHLSRIDVKPGDVVAKDQQMGLSGQTGMAGGDHLHFSMQVDGVQVNPREWWDEHWIHDRILSKIGK